MSRMLKLTLAGVCLVALVVAIGALRRQRSLPMPPAPEDLTGKPIEVAPPLLPDTPVFVGAEGVGADGYPLQHPDQGVLRHMALAGRFDELTDWIEGWQAAFEADPRKEYWPIDALGAFGTADPRLTEVLDRWVLARPASFVPHAAQGIHLSSVASARRGTKWANETSEEQFAQMRKFHALAKTALDKALELRPGLVAARRELISMDMAETGLASARRQIEAAVLACPECLQIRLKYLHSLHPKWGGSFDEMQLISKQAADLATRNPRLAPLTGFVDMIACEESRKQKRFEEATAACDRALASGDWFDALVAKGTLLRDQERYVASIDAYTSALKLWPGHKWTLRERAWSFYLADRPTEAAQDILAALRADPFVVPAELHQAVVRELVREGALATQAGDLDEAMEHFDRALAISPYDPEARGRRLMIVRQRGVAAEEIERLTRLARQQPIHFGAVRDLDDALIQQRRFEDITAAWTAYLSARPDDPYGYFERAGAYHHWGRREESDRDARQACAMGLQRACAGVR